MSQWYEASKKDMEIDGDEITIYVGSDEFGSIYVTVKIKDIRDLLSNPPKS